MRKQNFVFLEEHLEHVHNTMSDIERNEKKLMEIQKTPEYKEKLQKYKEFIEASHPNR